MLVSCEPTAAVFTATSEPGSTAIGAALARLRWVVLAVGLIALGLAAPSAGAFELLGQEVNPGEQYRLRLRTGESFAGVSVSTPVVVARGAKDGPTLCLTAGIHGDELIGIEVVRRATEAIDAGTLAGVVIGVPIVNPQGFRRSSRYLPDRRDLNRFFPGRELGSAASRIAFQVFDQVIRKCELLVDFHTGSFHRTNLPQLRVDLRDHKARRLARQFGTPFAVHSAGQVGTLRRAALQAGIPAITYEAGEPMRLHPDEIEVGVAGVERLMSDLGMTSVPGKPSMAPVSRGRRERQTTFYRSGWVRVDEGGILLASVKLGDRVAAGDELGTVIDPISNQRSQVLAPHAGTIIGMALNQVVIPGFAGFHVGMSGGGPRSVEEEDLESDVPNDVELEDIVAADVRPEE